MRFFLYFYYETHYTVGSAGQLKLGKKVATANTLFNLSSGNIDVGDYTIFGQNVMIITGRHHFHKGQRAGLQACQNDTIVGRWRCGSAFERI